MNMNQKELLVDNVRTRINNADFIALVDYKGSTVAQMDAFRRACEPVGTHFQVVKNTLSRRALEGTEKGTLSDHFKGPIGIFFSGEDPIGAAKLLKAQIKDGLSSYLYEQTRLRPLVFPVIVEV